MLPKADMHSSIKLNTKTGNFEFGNWIFSPTYQKKYLEEKLPLEGLELWSSNLQWQSFRLTMVRGYILVVMFKDGTINHITIFPIAKAENNDKDDLYEILMSLGGENNYHWGKVELSIDPKAGFKSIAIRYGD